MRRIFLIILLAAISVARLSAVTVTDTLYENARHLMVKTLTATYWYDIAGGGFSRMIDESGNDWIAFKREPWNHVPGSTASSFRGIPNAVYQGSDGGCGHPGFDKCTSSYEAPNTIRTKSLSGLWEWTWTFFDDCAVWNVIKTDTSRCYWFLYEGPAGGSFKPQITFWGNSDGFPLFDKPNHIGGEGISGNWEWVCIGRNDRANTLALVHATPDNESDWFSYMGNTSDGIGSPDGMAVFGFGRTPHSKPLLKGNHTFIISLINRENTISESNEQGFSPELLFKNRLKSSGCLKQ
jgi:hypothetical protein